MTILSANAPSSPFIENGSYNYLCDLPRGAILEKPKGPARPNISCRMIPNEYTSPLADQDGIELRRSSGALQNKSESEISSLVLTEKLTQIMLEQKT